MSLCYLGCCNIMAKVLIACFLDDWPSIDTGFSKFEEAVHKNRMLVIINFIYCWHHSMVMLKWLSLLSKTTLHMDSNIRLLNPKFIDNYISLKLYFLYNTSYYIYRTCFYILLYYWLPKPLQGHFQNQKFVYNVARTLLRCFFVI